MNATVRQHRWTLAEPPESASVTRLSRELNVPDPIAAILIRRGIADYESARGYFLPSLSGLHDPFLMDGMEAAVERITGALNRGEKLLVFGDYDVDGTNGAAMLYLFLKDSGGNVEYYIPDRIKEGYGISRQGPRNTATRAPSRPCRADGSRADRS